MAPYIIKEAPVSPGWTRDEIITAFFNFIFSGGSSKFVIVIKSHGLPAKL